MLRFLNVHNCVQLHEDIVQPLDVITRMKLKTYLLPLVVDNHYQDAVRDLCRRNKLLTSLLNVTLPSLFPGLCSSSGEET
jgi:hypothetical protein